MRGRHANLCADHTPPRIPAVKSHTDYLTVHIPERRDKRILFKVIGE